MAPVEAGSAELVVAQLAQTLDGRIATESGHSHYVSGEMDLVRLHRLRAAVDVVVVGAGTAAADDPRLTVRRWPGGNPVRAVLDPGGTLDPSLQVFRDGVAPTLHITGTGEAAEGPGVDGEQLPLAPGGGFAPRDVISLLRQRGLGRVLVEGGGRTVSSFLAAGLLHRLHLTVAPILLGSGRPSITLPPVDSMEGALRPRWRRFVLGDDVIWDLELQTDAPASS
ncbi:MAG: RibD family protein [Gemmatimonadales bacterium]|nr:MAG: RibD family protein [Gemmatimonadales bacterium]